MYRVIDSRGMEWGSTQEFSHPNEAIDYMNNEFGSLFWQRWGVGEGFWYAVFSHGSNRHIQFIIEPKPPLS